MNDIISIVEAMLEMGLLDRNRLTDIDYVLERVAIYINYYPLGEELCRH